MSGLITMLYASRADLDRRFIPLGMLLLRMGIQASPSVRRSGHRKNEAQI
jgi:hypothetical protein